MRITFTLGILALVAVASFAEEAPKPKVVTHGVVVFKQGDKQANDKQAGTAIDDLCTWLSGKVEGATFTRRGVRHKSADALKLLQAKDETTSLAIVSPGFFFANEKDLELTALAEAQRNDTSGVSYTLVGLKEQKDYPAGLTVATMLADDTKWLDRVVWPTPKDTKAIKWTHTSNLFDSAYEILDEEDGAPDFVLVDDATLKLLAEDEDLKVLKAGWKSATLPQELVVEVKGRLGDARKDIKAALKKLDQDDDGKKLAKTLQTKNFSDPDSKRVEACRKLYAS